MPRAKTERQDGAKGRFYRIGGVEYPSVTTILQIISKPALVAWSAKVEREMVIAEAGKLYGELISQEATMSQPSFCLAVADRLGKEKAHTKELAKAGEIGSQVHSLIEWQLRLELLEEVSPSPEIGPQAQLAYAGWQRWRQTVKLKPIWIERPVHSKTYGYAGTADLLAEVDGVETLLDWKSGKAIYAEAWLQNAAYRQCVREQGYGNPVKGMIVRLPKTEMDPEFEVQEAPEDECDLLKVFLTAFELWKWQNAEEKLLAGRTAPTATPSVTAPGVPRAIIPDWQPVSDSK
jgi:hypothetical protein